MGIDEVRENLINLAEPEYGEFIFRGAPSDYPVIGVRVPKIQEIANEILKSSKKAEEILTNLSPKSREEIHLLTLLLAGKINNFYKESAKERQRDPIKLPEDLKNDFFELILKYDSWEMVDLVGSRFKFVKKNREGWLEIIDELLSVNKKIREGRGENGEYFVRTGLVLLLNYYVEPEWIQVVFERILTVRNREEYYIKMAVAWLLQKCYAKYPDLTFAFMKNAELPEWTLRKTVSKIQDSCRIDPEWKDRAKTLIPSGKVESLAAQSSQQ